jgi:DMSO/TMAO reductase YedYZ molybdopterin-dependent catalytic subunit
MDVLALAKPLPTAHYVRVHAGNYVVPLSLAEAEHALLADTLNDQPLAVEHGAPWRLALAGGACFTSVKWVDRLELCAEPGENVGQRVAQRRAQLQQARAAAALLDQDV